jgi:catechol 2,3-dioxygenase-like lactoylglutathione lyase family enzyme
MKTKFGHIEVFVKEPLKAKDFYIDVLGFELLEIQSDMFVWLKMGDRTVLLRPGINTIQSETYQKTNIAIVLYTDDVAKALDTFIQRGLVIKGDDTGCPVFTDYDGNWFQLVNPDQH